MRHFLYGPFVAGRAAFGLLLLRLVAGAALMYHGWPKIQNPTGWMGPQSQIPDFLQALAAAAEFGGGLALILGLLTTIAAFGIACNFVGALWLVHIPKSDPFVNLSGGSSMELAALYLGIGLLYMFAGPGTWSLDEVLFDRGRVAIEELPAREVHLGRAA